MKATHFILVYQDPSGVHQTPMHEIKHLPYMLHNCAAWSQPALYAITIAAKPKKVPLHMADRIVSETSKPI